MTNFSRLKGYEFRIVLPCVMSVTSDGKLLSIGDDSGNVIVVNIDAIKLPKER